MIKVLHHHCFFQKLFNFLRSGFLLYSVLVKLCFHLIFGCDDVGHSPFVFVPGWQKAETNQFKQWSRLLHVPSPACCVCSRCSETKWKWFGFASNASAANKFSFSCWLTDPHTITLSLQMRATSPAGHLWDRPALWIRADTAWCPNHNLGGRENSPIIPFIATSTHRCCATLRVADHTVPKWPDKTTTHCQLSLSCCNSQIQNVQTLFHFQQKGNHLKHKQGAESETSFTSSQQVPKAGDVVRSDPMINNSLSCVCFAKTNWNSLHLIIISCTFVISSKLMSLLSAIKFFTKILKIPNSVKKPKMTWLLLFHTDLLQIRWTLKSTAPRNRNAIVAVDTDVKTDAEVYSCLKLPAKMTVWKSCSDRLSAHGSGQIGLCGSLALYRNSTAHSKAPQNWLVSHKTSISGVGW